MRRGDMRKPIVIMLFITIFYPVLCSAGIDPVPFPAPFHEGLNVRELLTVKDLTLGLWLQHRLMYNVSDIPGIRGTAFSDTRRYGFYRQRLRVGIDVRTDGDAGAYFQLEYRGGWGGSSPKYSDPRDHLTQVNPFNRLQARGIRYGFMYARMNDMLNISAGIIPLTDRVGRVLFDADWDFNVGGIVCWGSVPTGEYRFAYSRLVEGVGSVNTLDADRDEELLIVDYKPSSLHYIDLGIHLYSLLIPETGETEYSFEDRLGDITDNQTWIGFTARRKVSKFDIEGRLLLNRGSILDDSHLGIALSASTHFPVGGLSVDAMFLTVTGDPEGKTEDRFVTLHGLVGTEGYWGYTHIFTASPPSDVNDLGLEIGNNGAGLVAFQARATLPIREELDLNFAGGLFRSSEPRNDSRDMGKELSAAVTAHINGYLDLDLGLAHAFMGDFYEKDSNDLTELFSRLQFTW